MKIPMRNLLLLPPLLILLLASPAHAQDSAGVENTQVAIETSAGNIVIELFDSRSPLTVNNFLQYVTSGFYSGTVFHRIVEGFVIQGGGYDTSYKLKETRSDIPNESGNGLNNRRGYVAMARAGEPHSANSQFYINLADNLALDPRPTRWGYTVFGRVIEGMEVVDEIGYRATGAGPAPELSKDVPKEAITITKMMVLPAKDRLKTSTEEMPADE